MVSISKCFSHSSLEVFCQTMTKLHSHRASQEQLPYYGFELIFLCTLQFFYLNEHLNEQKAHPTINTWVLLPKHRPWKVVVVHLLIYLLILQRTNQPTQTFLKVH